MARWGLRILLILALALTGWWWLATQSMQRGIAAWLGMQRDAGLQADVEEISRGGFPMAMQTTLINTTLTDPQRSTALRIPQAKISAPIYWPGNVTVELPSDPITFATPQGTLTLGSDGAEAAMELRPGAALELEALAASSTNIILSAGESTILRAGTVEAFVQQTQAPETYTIDLTALDLALADTVRQALRLPVSLPAKLDPLVADMTVTFDRPWDRTALGLSRPQPRAIKVEQMTAAWDDIGLSVTADLAVDADGVATGQLRPRIRNAQALFERINSTGAIAPEWQSTIALIIRSMSDAQGNLDLTVTIDRGRMRIGFVPLGEAPRLIIR